jgi:hypothetical protein
MFPLLEAPGMGTKVIQLAESIISEIGDSAKRWDVSTAALIASNAVPLTGVLFLQWQIFPVVLSYWLENVVAGVFNVLRLALVESKDEMDGLRKLGLIPVFCLHYGFFAFVHGAAVFAFFGGTLVGHPSTVIAAVPEAIRRTGIAMAVLSIVVSHGISFATNYIRAGEYRRVTLKQVMTLPYKRVMVLHVAILGAALTILALGSPVFGLVLLILLKTGLDIIAHRAERRKLASTQ